MLARRGGGPSKRQPGTMNLRQIIRTGLTASALVHASVLTLVLWLAEAHPFGSVPADTIAVDVVTPEEVAQKKPQPDPTPTTPPSNAFDLPAKTAASSSAPSAPEQPSVPQKQAALPPARPERPQAKAQPQPPTPQPQPSSAQPQPSAAPPVPPSTTTATSYKPPEPDLTLKYHVMLGLPQGNVSPPPPLAASGDKSGDGGDAATEAADVSSSLIAEFQRHLRTCSKLPASVAASDNVMIKLRVFMTPDGKLAGAPVLLEASASMKGPLLMQSAIAALEACQPYAMLPANRYGEWKVLDLNFTPRDFAG
jgi:outer membrane biosynthesis protein TonB